MKTLLIFLLICTLPIISFANFDFNENCIKAYRSIFDLKLNNARAYINTERRLRPNNSIIPLLENYVDYFSLLTSESKIDFDKLKGNKTARLKKISDDDDLSPYYLYAQAEINLQWALLRGRYGEYFSAAMEIRKARNFLIENDKKFPEFLLNQKGLGLINAVLGNLPDGALKSALKTLGIKGNLDLGIAKLDRLASTVLKSNYQTFYPEVVFYYSYVLTDVAHSKNAYSKTIALCRNISDSSLLKSYLESYVAVRSGNTSQAIKSLISRPDGPLYQPFAYLTYLEGIANLNQLNFKEAKTKFNEFIQINKGVNYIKDSYLHLAWIDLLNNNLAGYKRLSAKVISEGFTYQEKDKQAYKEANAPTPSPTLLKARLLFDGGYEAKALTILKANSEVSYTSSKDKAEYYYRLGRVHEKLDNQKEAIDNYQLAITTGVNLTYYFAANAALQIGKIYEANGDKKQATKAYNNCLSMKNHDYQNSIDGEAQAGLNRVTR